MKPISLSLANQALRDAESKCRPEIQKRLRRCVAIGLYGHRASTGVVTLTEKEVAAVVS